MHIYRQQKQYGWYRVERSSLKWAIQREHMFLLKPWRESEHLASSSLDVLWSGIREAGKWWTQISELALAGATGTQTSSLNPTVFYQMLLWISYFSFSACNILNSTILQHNRSQKSFCNPSVWNCSISSLSTAPSENWGSLSWQAPCLYGLF